MFSNWIITQMIPKIPIYETRPPKLYDLLDSLINYKREEKINVTEFAKYGRSYFFDFSYNLSSKINKEEFETMILNHFLMRRIGFETATAFKIQLNVKLNEIMPIYNKLFDSLNGWNIFDDGEKTIRDLTDNNDTLNNLENKSTDITDLRFSDTPENEIDNVKSGKYMTNYNYNTGTNDSTSKGTSKSNQILHEEITRSPADKIAIYKEFQENIKNIYSMIFKDLECLFYQLI